MAFDPLASLAANDLSWRDQMSSPEETASALMAQAIDAEARVAALEGGTAGLQPNPMPATPAPTLLSSPYSLAPSPVGRLSYWDFTFAGTSTSIPVPLMLGRNAAGTKGIGIGSIDSTHISLYVVDSTGAVIRSPQYYIYSAWAPIAGHTYRIEFRAPPAGSAASEHVMRIYDKADLTTIIIGYEYQYLKAYYDPADCSYMSMASGATNTALSALQYGQLAGSTLPLEVATDSEVWAIKGSNLELTATLKYYKNTAPTGFTVKVGSGQPIIGAIQPSSTQGRAVIKAIVPKPAPGTPLTPFYSDADGSATATGKQYITPDIMQFATNITPMNDFYANSPMNNRVSFNWRTQVASGTSLRRWDESNPQMGRDGLPTAATITSLISTYGAGPGTFVKPPRKSGQLGRVRWRGNPGDVDFHITLRNYEVVNRGSNGTYAWIDYKHTFKLSDLVTALSFDGFYCWLYIKAGTPSEIICYDIDSSGNALSPTQWDKEYIADCKLFKGHSFDPIRCMDIQSVIDQSRRVVTLSDWATRGQYAAAGGLNILDLLDLFEQVGAGGRIHIPLQATEGWVRLLGQTLKAFLLRTGLYVSAAIANEIWNPGQPAWGICQNLYAADTTTTWPGSNTPTGHDKTLRYWSKLQYTVMTWLSEELGEALPQCSRVIEVQNEGGYSAGVVLTYWPGTEAVTDQIDIAPYVGNGAGKSISGSDSAAIDALIVNLKAAYPPVHANALKVKTYALSRNKKFGTYEGGYESFGNGPLQIAFKNDPRGFTMTKEILDDYESRIGSGYRWYCDNGHPAYGQRIFAGQSYFDTIDGAPPAYVGQAFISKMAATPLIA